jgi:HlyD family secretion protein
MRRWIALLAVFLIVVAGILVLRGAAGRRQAGTEFQTDEITRGTLQATVGATGTVRANQSATLSFQTSGAVLKIPWEVGEEVTTGQRLARLDPQTLSSQILLAQSDLITAERALEDLYDNEMALAQAQQNLAQAQDAVENAEYSQLVQQEGYRASAETIAAAQANLVLAQNEVDNAQSEYSKYSGRSEDDPVRALARSNLAAARQRRDSILRQLNWYLGVPSDTDQALLDADVAIALANLHLAEDTYQRLLKAPDPDDVAAAQARIDAAQATIDLAEIVAPFDGTITYIGAQSGDLVTPNLPVFELFDLSRFFVEVEVSEVDINKIEGGQPVTLVFDAILNREYEGEVVEVGMTGTNVQGLVSFTVEVEVLNPDELIHPGLTAAVNIVTREVEDVLIVPNRAVRVRDGQRVVFVLRGGLPEEIEVELGQSSDTHSEILAGDLEEGEFVILNPPAEINFGRGGNFSF